MLKEIVPIKDLRDQDYFRYNMSNAPPQNGARLDQQVSYLFEKLLKNPFYLVPVIHWQFIQVSILSGLKIS